MFYKVQSERRDNDIEISEMYILWPSKFWSKNIYKHFEVFCAFGRISCMITEDRVQMPGCSKCFFCKPFFLHELFETHNVFKIRHESNGIAATMKTTRSYHSYIAHSITDLTEELPELVEVALSLWSDSKFSYAAIELFLPYQKDTCDHFGP